ncbi:hypothetical protein [Lysinibacillus parviboronicapiens]|uniref:Uncharacterized protein n=1 Tax=Lysinibacillus parviboronicapiens TaxID=436516 RepID=A0ABV2PHF2_9BACI|nr:hypothetical protein [Lysinibacillus parviboronicapiens]
MRFITWCIIGIAVFYVVKGVKKGTFPQVTKENFNELNSRYTQEEPITRMNQHLQAVANNPLTGNFPTQNGI